MASSSSSEYSGSPFIKPTETISIDHPIAPLETSICQRLTEQIQAVGNHEAQLASPHDTPVPLKTLETSLNEAAHVIRYHAKWFAEQPLCDLLETTFEVTSTSSASADVYAATRLVDTVNTYSLLPPAGLESTVRFISAAYYHASRAHKTKRLAEFVWTTLERILLSHQGVQTVAALLSVVECDDAATIDSRVGYAQIAGALMFISEKLLLAEQHDRDRLPMPSLVELLEHLRITISSGNDNIREVIADVVSLVLADEHLVGELDSQCGWDALLETVSDCLHFSTKPAAAKSVVQSLTSHLSHLEPRSWPNAANMALQVDLRLETQLFEALLASCGNIQSTNDTPNGFLELLKKLSGSDQYLNELRVMTERVVVETVRRIPTHDSLVVFVGYLRELALQSTTTNNAADLLASALVALFRRSARYMGHDWRKKLLFQALCAVSVRSVPAAEVLFSIRADVEGAVYVESGLVAQAFPAHSTAVSSTAVMHDASSLLLEDWLNVIATNLESSTRWDIYYYCLGQLPSLLGNHTLFKSHMDFVQRIRAVTCELLDRGVYPEPPTDSGLTKSHVTLGLLRVLTALLSYHPRLRKQDVLQLVSTIVSVAGSRDHIASTPCIHALTICCYELPDLMASYMDSVIDKMSKMVAQKHLAIHVLLFLSSLSLHPQLYKNFQTRDFKKVFGVCGSYLQSIRSADPVTERQQASLTDQSSVQTTEAPEALPQYVYALAHHVIAFWYLTLKRDDRHELKAYITSCFRYTDADGCETTEDQGLVTIDLMDRVDAEEVNATTMDSFCPADGRIRTRHRLSGTLLITTRTALRTGKTIATVRRPTGRGEWCIHPSSSGHAGNSEMFTTIDSGDDSYLCVLPDDPEGRIWGRIHVPDSASNFDLPADENVERAIQVLDRTSALDSHKAGVIYIGEAQTTEDEILQNRMGSPDYVEFITSLGDLVPLKDANFNTQGLDRLSDADGQHAIIWHGEVTEIVFHITTLMPNNEDVALNTANKKRHTGNNYVNIIFNNSGHAFDFDTFPSQFNLVYIVMTPSARTSFLQTRTQNVTTEKKDRFYGVKVLTRAGYPAISSAADEKFISGASLPAFVRNLALNECIFSLMWAYGDEPGEYPSSWRSRLLQIRRLRERYG